MARKSLVKKAILFSNDVSMSNVFFDCIGGIRFNEDRVSGFY